MLSISDLRSPQQPLRAEFDKEYLSSPEEGSEPPRGCPRSHANGREWKTQERKYKDSVSYHEPIGVARSDLHAHCGVTETAKPRNGPVGSSVQDFDRWVTVGINNEILFNL